MTKLNKLVFLLLLGLFLTPQAHAEWVDISPSVEISQTRQALDRVKRVLFSYVTIKNTSGVTIEAPLQLNIVDPSIPVVNADGLSEDFHSYIQLDDDLLAGEEKIVRVSFQLARKKLIFSTQLVKEGYLQTAPAGDYYNPPSQARYISTNNTVNHIFRPYVDGAFIVWVAEGTGLEKVKEIAGSIGATIQGHFVGSEEYLFVVTKSGLTLQQMFELRGKLFDFSAVELASINYLQQEQAVTSTQNSISSPPPVEGDDQYYLKDAGILNAWTWLTENGKSAGGTDKIIGVIDNVLAFSHEDLSVSDLSSFCNSNSDTVVAQCVSQLHLYQGKSGILNLTPSPSLSEIMDSVIYSLDKERSNLSHGTHVTGIISAKHDGKGTSGVMKESQVLFMRGNIGLVSAFDDHWAQMRMVNDYGAKIINISWGMNVWEVIDNNATNFSGLPGRRQWCLFINEVDANGNPTVYIEEGKFFRDQLVTKRDLGELDFLDRPGCTKTNGAFEYGTKSLDSGITEILDVETELVKIHYTGSPVNGFNPARFGTNRFYKNTMDLASQNVLLVAGSGNGNQDGSMSTNPCSIRLRDGMLRTKVLCVGALAKPSEETPFPTKASYSNYGKSVDIFTFGTSINSTYLSYHLPELYLKVLVDESDLQNEVLFKRQEKIKDSIGFNFLNGTVTKYYKTTKAFDLEEEVDISGMQFEIESRLTWKSIRGTSMSAPIITGIAGLIWNAYPNITASQVRESIIKGTAKSVDNFKECSTLDSESPRVIIEDPVYLHKIPVANAYCALKYAEKINQLRLKPKNFVATAGIGQVELKWSSVSGVSYNIYYSTDADFTIDTAMEKIPGVTTPYTIIGLDNGKTYYFAVTAEDGSGESAFSEKDSAMPTANINVVDSKYYMVSAGENFTCAIHKFGVRCWGIVPGGNGVLDELKDIRDPREISAGNSHVCVVDGSEVKCWGGNSFGQITVPDWLSHPVQISAGESHTCAIDDVGVHCWGGNKYGQSDVPTDLKNPRQVSAGALGTCALDDVGVRCWGRAGVSSLYSNYAFYHNISYQKLTQVTVGGFSGVEYSHNCVLENSVFYTNGYKLACFKSDNYNHLGRLNWPQSLNNPTQISAGLMHTCVLDDNGVKCWGGNALGQASVPSALLNPVQISAGAFHTCAIDDLGVNCWGGSNGESIVPDNLDFTISTP